MGSGTSTLTYLNLLFDDVEITLSLLYVVQRAQCGLFSPVKTLYVVQV